MMHSSVDPLLVLVLLINFFVLGTSRLRAAISGTAVQGVILAALTISVHGKLSLTTALIAGGAVFVKAFLIPAMLLRAMREAAIRREIEPFIGYIATVLLGAVATGLSLMYTRTLPLAPEHLGSLLVPAS